MRHWTLALLLTACPVRKIPEHLRPPEPSVASERAPITNIDELTRAWVRVDPLARRDPTISPEDIADLDGGAAYAELLRSSRNLANAEVASLQALKRLEQVNRGTPIVALSRGARLRMVQSLLADGGGGSQGRTLALLTPHNAPHHTAALPMGAMQWLAQPAELRDQGLLYGDRWVLTGWLDGPEIDVKPVADALGTSPFDHVRQSAMGRLLLARAAGRTGDVDGAHQDLERATIYALQSAVADSNAQQRALKTNRDAMIDELGEQPNFALLTRAAEGLAQNASDDRSTGGALLALTAARLHRSCDDEPCVGLDRVSTIEAAGRWHPKTQRLARLWQIAALKNAIDSVQTARETVRAHNATIELVDALNGTGAPPLDGTLLMRRRPDSQSWLVIGRALGEEQVTTWDTVYPLLKAHLHSLAEQAQQDERDPTVRSYLKRL
ncbi:MAG: hypothetical protein ACI9MC_002885 [Kiritimatiellia bacterium]|jgi:hypothetical protein